MNDSHSTEVIRETLTNILGNARFASSPQMSAFLRYVIEEAVAGNADRIKAYSVAVDALGKPESFDAQRDPCVRVLAMRLRESLSDYYQEHNEPVVFTIPRGSYKPNFVYAMDTASSLACRNPTHEDSTLDKTDNRDGSLINTTLTAISEDETRSPSPELHRADPGTDGELPNTDPSAPELTFLARLRSRHWMVAALLLVLGTWVVLTGRQEPMSEAMPSASNDETLQDPQMGAAEPLDLSVNLEVAPRPRPNLPTVHIRASADSDELIRQMGIAVGGVLSKFNDVVVIRNHVGISQADAWPEDYELLGSTVAVNGTIRISAELVHVASGSIANTTVLEVVQDDGNVVTEQIIELVEAFSAQLARHDGPLISDYRQRTGIHPELACLYDLHTQLDRDSNANGHKQNETVVSAAHTERCEITPSLLDDTRISSIMLSVYFKLDAAGHATTPEERQALLENASMLAEKAVSLGHYRADTHALHMQALRLTGALEQAVIQGAKAMELNPFDSAFLRRFAILLSEVDEQERAEAVKAMADKLDLLKGVG